jgi:hypothetical protein
MREQFRIGSRLSWVVAWLLVVAALAISLFWPSTLTFAIAMVFVAPIVGLTAWRAEQKGYSDPYSDTGDGFPWGPPS